MSSEVMKHKNYAAHHCKTTIIIIVFVSSQKIYQLACFTALYGLSLFGFVVVLELCAVLGWV